MLNVDVTRAARSHAERLALVAAVEAAPAAEPETDWIEWKSELDLTTAEGRFKCARSLLGFGNRDPDFAGRFANGCAYFFVGVEPGNLTGTTVHDPADVEQWLAPYIAAGEPQWSVDYISTSGVSVMLITVEAPRWGDPIFTLRKAFDRTGEGAIFVRKGGKTDFASSQDISRLTARAARRGVRVALSVIWDGEPELRAVTIRDDAAEAFAAREAERLARPEPPRPDPFRFEVAGLRETRSGATYDAEVARYMENVPLRVRVLGAKLAVERQVAPLRLAVTNETEVNFSSVQVALTLPGDVLAFFDTDDLDEGLSEFAPPPEWGKGYLDLARFMQAVARPAPTDERGIQRLDDTVVLTLPSVDVRPRTPHSLRPVFLALPPSYAGQSLEVRWRATSTSADGEASGVLAATVADDVVDLTDAVLIVRDD